MDGLKQEIKTLIEQREAIELEITERSARLQAPGMPGLRGPLVDDEGFPFSHIDVFQVRADRNRLAVLHTDHREITGKIESKIHELHALASSQNQTTEPLAKQANKSTELCTGTTSAQAHAEDPTSPPFALVDEVSEGSPASEAGIRPGDRVCRFGSIKRGAAAAIEALKQIAALLQQHEGEPVDVVVAREGRVAELTVVPRVWDGRGLLGCHMVPL